MRPGTAIHLASLLALQIVALGPRPLAAKISSKSLGSCQGFTSHAEIGELLQAWEQTHPQIARAGTIGESVEGREIWSLLVSADPDQQSAEPELRVIGTIHGDECMSVEVVLETIAWILDGYGDDPLASDLVDGAELLFVPLVNPDGYSGEEASRRNAHGIDLNRNLGFGWLDEGERPFSEPETVALRDVSLERSFTLGLTYHTVANYVNGAWNYKPHHPLDEELFAAIGQSYAGDSGYDVVFGWDWYGINGDVNDWSLGVCGTFDWTVELRSDTELEWNVHGEGVAAFLAWALGGAEGLVTDAISGDPLEARIHVDPPGEPIFTDPDVGDYHRVLLPGTYDITAVANGYLPATVEDVVVPAEGTVAVDFALEPDGEHAALRVDRMTMPQAIPNYIYQWIDYDNTTRVHDALGGDDGRFYSLSPGGTITLDLGEGTGVVDGEGADLLVISGTGSDDPADVLLAGDRDGPFDPAAAGSGNIEIDLAEAGLAAARFVRVADTGAGQFNVENAGYDLDAVINLSPEPSADADTDADANADTDADLDTDSGSETAAESPPLSGPASAGCGCANAGEPRCAPLERLFRALL